MSTEDVLEQTTTEPAAEEPQPQAPRPKAPPITSRFLFVDVAAMRAKQLRRGALPRLSEDDEPGAAKSMPHKPERIAMEEVRRGLIPYEVPASNKPGEY